MIRFAFFSGSAPAAIAAAGRLAAILRLSETALRYINIANDISLFNACLAAVFYRRKAEFFSRRRADLLYWRR